MLKSVTFVSSISNAIDLNNYLLFRCSTLIYTLLFSISYIILLFRSFQRLVPITNICSADLKSINKTVLENFLPGEHTKGSVSVSRRD